MYDADPAENLRRSREVAAWLRGAGADAYEAHCLAILGRLPNTDGGALHQAVKSLAGGPVGSLAALAQLTLAGGGRPIVTSSLTVAEAYARVEALGYDSSPEPIAFHCIED